MGRVYISSRLVCPLFRVAVLTRIVIEGIECVRFEPAFSFWSKETIIGKLESKFQADLRKELHALFPGCITLKNDAAYLQGVPDIIVLYGDRYAMLECKKTKNSALQPNQEYYVDLFDRMSYAAFIYPENKEAILAELQQAFRTRR